MKLRLPLMPTIIVAAAVLVMIGLGIWQIDRKGEKEAMLARAAANPSLPAITFPRFGPVDPAMLFRPSSIHCLHVAGWRTEAGRAADGSVGYRFIAECATGAEGPGALVALGVAQKPDAKPGWTGGQIAGWISEEPDHRPFLARLMGKATPLRPMLIARSAPAGLKAVAPPSTEDVPNNHLAYAVQWFFFAAVAVAIYLLAVRKRQART
ncbi:MAG: SURF1 family protein [Sphingobium sp.]